MNCLPLFVLNLYTLLVDTYLALIIFTITVYSKGIIMHRRNIKLLIEHAFIASVKAGILKLLADNEHLAASTLVQVFVHIMFILNILF